MVGRKGDMGSRWRVHGEHCPLDTDVRGAQGYGLKHTALAHAGSPVVFSCALRHSCTSPLPWPFLYINQLKPPSPPHGLQVQRGRAG